MHWWHTLTCHQNACWNTGAKSISRHGAEFLRRRAYSNKETIIISYNICLASKPFNQSFSIDVDRCSLVNRDLVSGGIQCRTSGCLYITISVVGYVYNYVGYRLEVVSWNPYFWADIRLSYHMISIYYTVTFQNRYETYRCHHETEKWIWKRHRIHKFGIKSKIIWTRPHPCYVAIFRHLLSGLIKILRTRNTNASIWYIYQLTEAKWRIYSSVNKPALVQIMACRLTGAKPFSESMLGCYWLAP